MNQPIDDVEYVSVRGGTFRPYQPSRLSVVSYLFAFEASENVNMATSYNCGDLINRQMGAMQNSSDNEVVT